MGTSSRAHTEASKWWHRGLWKGATSRGRFLSADHQLHVTEPKWWNPWVALFLVCKLIFVLLSLLSQSWACFQRKVRYRTMLQKAEQPPAVNHRNKPSSMAWLSYYKCTKYTENCSGCVKDVDNVAEKFSDASVGSVHCRLSDSCLREHSTEQTMSRPSYSQPHQIRHFMTLAIISNVKNLTARQETGWRNFHFLIIQAASEDGPIFQWP